MPLAYSEPCCPLPGEMHLKYGMQGRETAGRIITANIVTLDGALHVTCTNLAGATVLEVDVKIDANICDTHFLFVRRLGWRAIAFLSGDGEQVLGARSLRGHSQLTLMELEEDPVCDACHESIRGALILQDGRALHFGCRDVSEAWSSGLASDMSDGS